MQRIPVNQFLTVPEFPPMNLVEQPALNRNFYCAGRWKQRIGIDRDGFAGAQVTNVNTGPEACLLALLLSAFEAG
jgi:hypothetical protein